MRILLISILGLLTLASCTKQEPMEALIDRVFAVAEQQYTTMDTRLTEKTLPARSLPTVSLFPQISIGGAAASIPVPFGISTNIPGRTQ